MSLPATTLSPGAAPTLIAEHGGTSNDPITLINDGNVRVYLGDAAVSPATGTPLDPATSTQWSSGDQLWAVVDPDATGSTTLRVTDDVSSWTPSPAAIAAQVATALLAGGVPNVLLIDQLAPIVLGPGMSNTWDVSKYASAIVLATSTAPVLLAAAQESGSGNADVERLTVDSGQQPARIALTGSTLFLRNDGTAPVSVKILASNRAAQTRLDTRANTAGGDQWTNDVTVGLAAGVNNLTQTDTSVALQGSCRLFFACSTGIKGRLQVAPLTGVGYAIELLDTAQCIPSDLGGLIASIDVALPPGAYMIQFHTSTAYGPGNALRASFVPHEI